MKVLIVENNDIKFKMLERWLGESYSSCSVERAKSYQGGMAAIESDCYDWILLDMTLPVFDEKAGMFVREQLTFGGRLILEEMTLSKVRANVIVVTQYRTFSKDGAQVTFEKLRSDLMEEFSEVLRDCVVIRGQDQTWMDRISTCINETQV